MANIYDYMDYRKFLRGKIEEYRQSNPNLSYRNLNMRFGFNSSGFLNTVLSGERNIGKKAMNNICKGLSLNEKESRFFETLVCFNQAKTVEEKDYFYNKLVANYPIHHPKILEAKHYKIFANWYYIAILELVRTVNFDADPDWISKKLKPNVPAKVVSEALEDLEETGLIVRDNEGKFKRPDYMITTPDVVSSLSLIKFHEQLNELSMDALRKDQVCDKEYSTLTVATSQGVIQKIKKVIQDCQNDIHALLETSKQERTEVVHINMQMFKLTNGGCE